ARGARVRAARVAQPRWHRARRHGGRAVREGRALRPARAAAPGQRPVAARARGGSRGAPRLRGERVSRPWNVTLRVGDAEQVFQTVEREDDHHLLSIGSSALADVTIAHPDVAPIAYWLVVNDAGYTWLR